MKLMVILHVPSDTKMGLLKRRRCLLSLEMIVECVFQQMRVCFECGEQGLEDTDIHAA